MLSSGKLTVDYFKSKKQFVTFCDFPCPGNQEMHIAYNECLLIFNRAKCCVTQTVFSHSPASAVSRVQRLDGPVFSQRFLSNFSWCHGFNVQTRQSTLGSDHSAAADQICTFSQHISRPSANSDHHLWPTHVTTFSLNLWLASLNLWRQSLNLAKLS